MILSATARWVVSIPAVRLVLRVKRYLTEPDYELKLSLADDEAAGPAMSLRRRLSEAVALGLLYTLLAMIGIDWTTLGGSFATIGLANGIIAGWLARRPLGQWRPYVAVVGVAALVSNLQAGSGLLFASVMAAANLVEILLAAWFAVTLGVWRPEAMRIRSVMHLIFWVAALPCISSGLLAWLAMRTTGAHFMSFMAMWLAAEMLGILIVGTFTAIVTATPWRSLSVGEKRLALPSLFILVGLATWVFRQSEYSMLYLVFPALVCTVFIFGRVGAAAGVLIVMIIATPLTLHGSGPIGLSPIKSSLHAVLQLQSFLIVLFLTALPVAMVLADRAALQESMNRTNRILKRLATTDPLTSALNRRAFEDQLNLAIANANRSRTPLSIVMLDVDYFKLYNDSYGHQAGDEVLRSLVLELSSVMSRRQDVIARYGGEEFVAILPQTDAPAAYALAQQAEQAFREACIEHRHAPSGICTISLGVATQDVSIQGDIEAASLLASADAALYTAKRKGRARVEHAQLHLPMLHQAEVSHH